MRKCSKIMTALLLTVVLLSSLCVTALADGNVTYDGKVKKFDFTPGSQYSKTDLFTDFKNVMPGDVRTQKVIVKNADTKKSVRIYMRVLGSQPGSEDFLNEMMLTVSSDDVLFNAPADQTAQLTEWRLLGSFTPGQEMPLDVTLDVPITMDNNYQFRIGYLDWQFKVEEIPEQTPESNPETGDTMNIGLWIGVTAFCLVGLVVVIAIKKRKDKDER